MPDSSSHLSVRWVCVWPSPCDSLITQHRETGDAGSASEDAWKSIQLKGFTEHHDINDSIFI